LYPLTLFFKFYIMFQNLRGVIMKIVSHYIYTTFKKDNTLLLLSL